MSKRLTNEKNPLVVKSSPRYRMLSKNTVLKPKHSMSDLRQGVGPDPTLPLVLQAVKLPQVNSDLLSCNDKTKGSVDVPRHI